MKLNLISLDTIKTQLGISDITQDAAITAMIPIVSADVRRILNYKYDETYPAKIVSGSNILNVFNSKKGYNQWPYYRDVELDMGQVVYSSALPDDTYIISEDDDTGQYTMSATAAGNDDEINPTITIAQWPTIAKMVLYRITAGSTTSVNEENFVSRSVGPLSINLGQGQINKRWNYPQRLIDDLGVPFVEVG
jgi:hypothetical protein